MPDLDTILQDYAAFLEDELPPPAVEPLVSTTPLLPTDRVRWRPAVVFGAAALAVLAIGVPLLVFGVVSSPSVGETPGTTSVEPTTTIPADALLPATFAIGGVDGTWERSIFEGGFIVEDLHATSFGLVAAAGPEGIWISTDGTAWDQVIGSNWPQMATTPTEVGGDPTPITTVPTPVVGLTSVEAVIEYRDALYAFGYEITDPADALTRVVWRSADGQIWEKAPIDGFPQMIDAVAGPNALLLVGRDVNLDPEAENGPIPGRSTVIFRSTDGKEFSAVNTSGLEGFLVWTISRFGDSFVALGDKGLGGTILSSPDGIVWEEVGPLTVTRPEGQAQPMSYSIWALVELFDTPYGLVTVGSPEPFNPQKSSPETRPRIMVATSTDGQSFVEMDDQTQLFQLEDQRDEMWPPLRPPQGTIVGNRLILLGHSYPDNTGEPAYHQWIWSPLQN
jgi:hypothetical protein